MAPFSIVISFEIAHLPRQVDRVPEQHTIKILTPNRADQPLDERMRYWNIGNRLDLINIEHAQVSKPPVEAKQRIVVRTYTFRFELPAVASLNIRQTQVPSIFAGP